MLLLESGIKEHTGGMEGSIPIREVVLRLQTFVETHKTVLEILAIHCRQIGPRLIIVIIRVIINNKAKLPKGFEERFGRTDRVSL